MDDLDTELVSNSDEDWMTENEEQCVVPQTLQDKQVITTNNSTQLKSKLQFIGIGIVLILSSTYLLILLPLYMIATDLQGDGYTIMLFVSTVSVLFLTFLILIVKQFSYNSVRSIIEIPAPIYYIIKIGFSLGFSAIMIVYSVREKRVMCHLQDPIKGILLVFSLIFYFFFCRKLMGLQRIFSCTTIIVGLFISVDYGLCDEFRCRGYKREVREEDAGKWSTRTHALWSTIYIIGLGLYAAHFTLLERCLVSEKRQLHMSIPVTSTTILTTVSRTVSSHDTAPLTSTEATITSKSIYEEFKQESVKSVLALTLWIQFVVWIIITLFFWTDLIPGIGKVNNFNEFWNITKTGLTCHFQFLKYSQSIENHLCGNVSLYGWIFVSIYIIFSLTTVKFVELSQSAVFTVAMITTALPIAGVWWSLFQISDIHNGTIIWAPTISGELICALLGLPIVLLGIILLYKSHFKEITPFTHKFVSNNDSNMVEREYSSTSTGIA